MERAQQQIRMTQKEFKDKLLSYHDDESIDDVRLSKKGKSRVLRKTIIEEYLLTDLLDNDMM